MTDHRALSEDLSRFLDDTDDLDFETEPYPAESLDQANRWLRAIKRFDQRAAAIERLAQVEIDRITEWRDEQLAPIMRRRGWLERSCQLLAAALFAKDPKVVTHNVPNGKISSRKPAPNWEYPDQAAFVAWAREHRRDLLDFPEAPPPRPDKNAVKKALADCVPDKAEPGDVFVPTVVLEPEIPVGDGAESEPVEVPGLRVVIPDREWKIDPN